MRWLQRSPREARTQRGLRLAHGQLTVSSGRCVATTAWAQGWEPERHAVFRKGVVDVLIVGWKRFAAPEHLSHALEQFGARRLPGFGGGGISPRPRYAHLSGSVIAHTGVDRRRAPAANELLCSLARSDLATPARGSCPWPWRCSSWAGGRRRPLVADGAQDARRRPGRSAREGASPKRWRGTEGGCPHGSFDGSLVP